MLSEISPLQQDQICIILLHEVSRVVKSIETEGTMGIARAWASGQGSGETVFNGNEASAWENENVLRWIVVVAQQCECTVIPLNCAPKMIKIINFVLCIIYHN